MMCMQQSLFRKDITLFKEGVKGKVVLANEPNSSYPVSVMVVSKIWMKIKLV